MYNLGENGFGFELDFFFLLLLFFMYIRNYGFELDLGLDYKKIVFNSVLGGILGELAFWVNAIFFVFDI